MVESVSNLSEIITALFVFQVDSPLNLKHPHDVVIFMRQETRVNYLKKLEVCGFSFISMMSKDAVKVACSDLFEFGI